MDDCPVDCPAWRVRVCLRVFLLWELQVGHTRHNMGFNSDQQPLCQKGGDEAISPGREGEEGKNEGNCEFDSLNGDRH